MSSTLAKLAVRRVLHEGSEVTVLEFLDQITPGMDLEICKALQ